MPDISTLWMTTRGDWGRAGADLASGNDIVTAVLISLFTDREANADDPISDGSRDRRGWWGDEDAPLIGSRLWLLERAKQSQATLAQAQSYIEEALQWLIDDGAVTRVDVFVEWTRFSTLGARVAVYHRGQTAPIEVGASNVFDIAQAHAWTWNPATGSGEWTPVALTPKGLPMWLGNSVPMWRPDVPPMWPRSPRP